MAQTTWIQCMINKADWDKINERRLRLKLKWNELLLPATLEYLGKLERTERFVDRDLDYVLMEEKGKTPEAEIKTKVKKAK